MMALSLSYMTIILHWWREEREVKLLQQITGIPLSRQSVSHNRRDYGFFSSYGLATRQYSLNQQKLNWLTWSIRRKTLKNSLGVVKKTRISSTFAGKRSILKRITLLSF